MSEKQAKYTNKDFQVGQTVYIEQIGASSTYMLDTVGENKRRSNWESWNFLCNYG